MAKPDPIATAVTSLVAAITDLIRAEIQAQASAAPRRHAPDAAERTHHRDQDRVTVDEPGRVLTPDSLLTVSEAIAELRIGITHFYKLVGQGELRTLKLGSRTLIQYREILRFISDLDRAT